MSDAGFDQPIEGRFAGAEHRLPVRVYFEDTDLSGVVYHANYLRFMERARSDMLRLAGIDQRTRFEAGEGAYAVASLAIRYAARAAARRCAGGRLHAHRGARRQRRHSPAGHARCAGAGRGRCGGGARRPRRPPQAPAARLGPTSTNA